MNKIKILFQRFQNIENEQELNDKFKLGEIWLNKLNIDSNLKKEYLDEFKEIYFNKSTSRKKLIDTLDEFKQSIIDYGMYLMAETSFNKIIKDNSDDIKKFQLTSIIDEIKELMKSAKATTPTESNTSNSEPISSNNSNQTSNLLSNEEKYQEKPTNESLKPYENLLPEDMEGEVWKDVPGYEGIYQASNYVELSH